MTVPLRTGWDRLDPQMQTRLAPLPRTLRLLLENALAQGADQQLAEAFVTWLDGAEIGTTVPFLPTRILMQDTAGVAALVSLAAQLEDAPAARLSVPVDLVIDHSVKVDVSGTADAAERNLALEFARSSERYAFFKWAGQAFTGLRIIPPGNGICHQINLEQLASIARPARDGSGLTVPEVVIGTDSHTTMVNALGILGWGVGGLEAEGAARGIPSAMPIPPVTELRLSGALRAGATATDAALALTAFLRRAGVVGHFVEFTGPGAATLRLADRAAIANMAPEYGATTGFFAVDRETLAYLAAMGRTAEDLQRCEAYARQTGLWAGEGEPRRYSRSLAFDLATVEAVMAGPARPHDVLPLSAVPASLPAPEGEAEAPHGAVLIAAITSCTNTANPLLMVQAGLVAQRAVERGLAPPPWVKISLAPGSRSIAELLQRLGLRDSLAQIGFSVVGFGCTTCVGNSGELTPAASDLLARNPALVSTAVLSGNRNFPNRVHAQIRANYLASPPLVVAAALKGSLAEDLATAPLGRDRAGGPVMLADLWPAPGEAEALLAGATGAGMACAPVESPHWVALDSPRGPAFPWNPASLMIRKPPVFTAGGTWQTGRLDDAAPLLWLGDGITTDHISPIGAIAAGSPAARWLSAQGWAGRDFSSYGDFRGNHEVMVRGTFDNRRLHNLLAGRDGNWALGPDGAEMDIYTAAQAFRDQGRPLVVVAGDAYGCGSARDWAAKGTALLGIRTVIARSFERIHRSNLVATGVLPIRLADAPPLHLGRDSRISVDLPAGPGIRAPARITVQGTGAAVLAGVAELHTAQEVAMLTG